MTVTPTAGSRVLLLTRGRFQRVVHQLERVRDAGVACPYVMACGYAACGVIAAPADAPQPDCGRCWPVRSGAA